MDNWTTGNEFDLLENGEEFFPELFAAIDQAEREVVLETYIWYEDEIGRGLARRLVEAAQRGVDVRVTVDGFGSPSFSEQFLSQLANAGVSVFSFDNQPTFGWIRTNVFCRLHRKVAVIDRRLAFVGGINIWAQHLRNYGRESMQDYAVCVEGPVVNGILESIRHENKARPRSRWRRWRNRLRKVPKELSQPKQQGQAIFVTRDNEDHPSDIEAMYRLAIRKARKRIVIANAYFFPSYRFLRDLARAARRGVDVALMLQGKPDVPISALAASVLYQYLRASGVKIYHYNDRALHAKVAVIDDSWATIGSSNLDPISLGFNLEGNLFMLDERFAAALMDSLRVLIRDSCAEVPAHERKGSLMSRLVLSAVYFLTRGMPGWGQAVLSRRQPINVLRPSQRT